VPLNQPSVMRNPVRPIPQSIHTFDLPPVPNDRSPNTESLSIAQIAAEQQRVAQADFQASVSAPFPTISQSQPLGPLISQGLTNVHGSVRPTRKPRERFGQGELLIILLLLCIIGGLAYYIYAFLLH